MRIEAVPASLIMLLAISLAPMEAAPIKARVPIYVPANLPVTGTVCLPSALAAGLKAKLYVDNAFVEEGSADEVGCYKVTIGPLTLGRHELYAEIYKGSIKVAEISAEVIAIEGMITVRPDPLATLKRGETKEVSLFIENRSPVNMSNVRIEMEAPFPIYAEHMTRVRNFVVRGSIGDLRVNETKEIRMELAIPSNFRLGTHTLRINMTYVVGESTYSAPLEVSVVIAREGTEIPQAQQTTSQTISAAPTVTQVKSTTSPESRVQEPTPAWLFLLIAFVGALVVGLVLWMVTRPR
ncbi:MAG: hypothetical protein QI197_05680 [Candidatus Korarchaeota archaeon]|nr:hypothetical protein [Candidatus Korarchaeota archaeon]